MRLIEADEQPETEEPAGAEENSPAETEPQAAERNTNGGESRLPLHALLILVATGLIVGLVFLARWIYHATKHTSVKQPSTTQTQNNGSKKSAGVNAKNNGSNGGNIAITPGSNNQSSKNSSKHPKPTATLPNNGPGNVIGVFAAASFAAGALHYIVSLRKAARES